MLNLFAGPITFTWEQSLAFYFQRSFPLLMILLIAILFIFGVAAMYRNKGRNKNKRARFKRILVVTLLAVVGVWLIPVVLLAGVGLSSSQ